MWNFKQFNQTLKKILLKNSFVKNNHVAFMVNSNKDINWLRHKIFRYNGLCINFFINFPFDLFLKEVNVHINTWICIFSNWCSSASPFKSGLILVVNVSVIKMKCYGTAWNESFLKLLGLFSNAKDDAVMYRLYYFERYFTLLIGS